MSGVDLNSAISIFDFTGQLTVKPIKLEWNELSVYSELLNKLLRELGESAADDYWKPVIRYFKNYRFALCSTPLSPDHCQIYPEERSRTVSEQLRHCETLFSGIGPTLDMLRKAEKQLHGCGYNPIASEIQNRFSRSLKNHALLIKESRHVHTVEQMLGELGIELHVVTPAQLRGGDLFDSILILGPARWFPDSVFYSPRAKEITLLTFSFISDSWKRKNPFVGTSAPVNNSQASGVKPTLNYSSPGKGNAVLEPDEIIPRSDWEEISQIGLKSRRPDTEENSEEVAARLLVLEGDQAVFLEAFDSSRALIIDFETGDTDSEDEDESFVNKIETSGIRPGMFILLRTRGGGDYILPIANRILGKKASYSRAIQSRWKELLANKISDYGLTETCARLEEFGAIRANETNLRNWVSPRLIRPRAEVDFLSIIRLIADSITKDEYFAVAARIHKSHQKAGHRIKKLLVDKVNNSDLSDLHRLGQMDFELSEFGGESLTAFRVLSRAPQSFEVPASQIGIPFDMSVYHEHSSD